MSFEKIMNKHKEKLKERVEDDIIQSDDVYFMALQCRKPDKKEDPTEKAKSVYGDAYIKINGIAYSIHQFAKAVGYFPDPVTNDYLDAFKNWAWGEARGNKRTPQIGDVSVPDMVNHPSHYTAGGIETLDFVREKLNANTAIDHWQAYCFGNALKYITRAGLKGDMKEDIKKAIFYLRSAIGDDPR